MDKAFLYILLMILVNSIARAQTELVYNGSFELRSDCPTNSSQPGADQLFALGWYAPTAATTDYFNSCDLTMTVGVPQNQWGYQDAHTGVAYTAIYYISGRGHSTGKVFYNYSEYLQSKLVAPMKNGYLYKIQLFVSRADSINGNSTPRLAGSAVDQFGVLLAKTQFLGSIPYLPNCCHTHLRLRVPWACYLRIPPNGKK